MPRGFCRCILNSVIGKYVLVKLKNGRTLRGRLIGFDDHLNLVLEEARFMEEETRELGSIILRGDNIVYIVFQVKSIIKEGETS